MSTARPRLLFLSQCLPYPPHSGVAARTYNILTQLQQEYDVDLVAFYRRNHQPDRPSLDQAWEALQRYVAFVAEPTPIPSEHSVRRKIWDHLRSVVSGRVYTYYEYHSRSFAERLRAAIRAHAPDLVHLDSLDLHRWLRAVPKVPVTCTHHDVDSDLLRRRARHLKRSPQREYFLFQASRIERLERELCPRLALNVMMSEVDARKLRARAPGAPTIVVPNGTDTDYFQPNGTMAIAGRVVFVGPTHSHPNRDAIEFLLHEIWPAIRAAGGSTSLRLIGGSKPSDQMRYNAESGVMALGHVPDIRPALSEALCCVVPIRIGGGTRLKILDAWAMGKAVVSTSIGCEGLDAIDGENILIRNTPDAFADAVLQVLSNAALRAGLERNARETAVKTYSWKAVGRGIRSAYEKLLDREHGAILGNRPRSVNRPLLASIGTLAIGMALATLSCGTPASSRAQSGSGAGPPLHEPAGFVQFSDQPWDALNLPSLSIVGRLQARLFRRTEQQPAWSYSRRTSSKDDDIVEDVDAPRSPPQVLRIIYTPDMAHDAEPSVHWIALPVVRQVYAAWWFKLSPNWYPNPAGGGKISFLQITPDGQGQVYTALYHPSDDGSVQGPPFRIAANTEWAPYGQRVWYPNVTTTWINPGEWHRVEFYWRWGTAGDGIIRWWVDGVLNGDHRTVAYPGGGVGFSQFEFAPTIQIPPPTEQYMYIDHTYISIAGVR